MNSPDSSAPPPQAYTVTVGRSGQQSLSAIPIGNGLQMPTFAAAANQQSMTSAGASMLSNDGDATMMDPPLMLSMNMAAAENGMGPLDPQLSSVGDQFAALATASPLTAIPNDFGSLGGGSTLTEFTKRRNWSQRILEELQDFLHVLTPTGKLVYASPSSRALTGFGVEELIGKFITDFIHEDDSSLYATDPEVA
jgi:PAS domain-containing protein